MSKKLVMLGVLLGLVLAISLAFNACAKFSAQLEKSSLIEEMSTLGSTETIIGETAGFPVDITFNNSVSINLADQRRVVATVTAKPGFNGNVKLAVDRTMLNALDPQQNIVITPAEFSIDLLEGETKSREFVVTTTSMTKSGMGQIQFLLTPTSGTYEGAIQGDAIITVNALYQVNLSGPASGSLMVWSSGAFGSRVDFSPNPGGVTIRFVNIDPAIVHQVHVSPNKYHQSTTFGNGQIYDILVTETAANFQVPYFCHLHGSADRFLRFNVAQ